MNSLARSVVPGRCAVLRHFLMVGRRTPDAAWLDGQPAADHAPDVPGSSALRVLNAAAISLLPSHGAARRSVRLHSAEADPLRARSRFERALADVEWSPPALPPRALLFVRQRVGISLRQKNLWASFGSGRLPST